MIGKAKRTKAERTEAALHERIDRLERDLAAKRVKAREDHKEIWSLRRRFSEAQFTQMEAEAKVDELTVALEAERIAKVDWWSPETSGRELGFIDPKIMDEADSESDGAPADFDRDDANVVTSVIAWENHGPDGERIPAAHWPVLDIDFEARLVPSSTPGHYHLYLEKHVDHDQYMRLLEELERTGIVGPGYDHFSRQRGYTTARLPHVKKPTATPPAECGHGTPCYERLCPNYEEPF